MTVRHVRAPPSLLGMQTRPLWLAPTIAVLRGTKRRRTVAPRHCPVVHPRFPRRLCLSLFVQVEMRRDETDNRWSLSLISHDKHHHRATVFGVRCLFIHISHIDEHLKRQKWRLRSEDKGASASANASSEPKPRPITDQYHAPM